MSKPQHTFLFADLVGFTSFTVTDGDEAAADLATSFSIEATRLAAQHGAETIKSIGDEVMVCGSDPAEAVRLGLRIVDELAAVLPVRVGMHSGSAVQRAGDWFGAAVNLASRVSAAAAGGEVLVTDVTRTACGRSLRDVELHSRGLMAFKNVELPVRVSIARSRAPQPAPTRPTVVERLASHPAADLQPA